MLAPRVYTLVLYRHFESGRVSLVFENTEGDFFVEVSSFQGVMTREIPLYIVHVHMTLYVHNVMYRSVVDCTSCQKHLRLGA